MTCSPGLHESAERKRAMGRIVKADLILTWNGSCVQEVPEIVIFPRSFELAKPGEIPWNKGITADDPEQLPLHAGRRSSPSPLGGFECTKPGRDLIVFRFVREESISRTRS